MSHDIEDQLRQYFHDTTTVGGGPNLVSNAVHTGRVRRRRHRGAAVVAAATASLGLVLAVPMVQSAMAPDQPASRVPASVPAQKLPQIATSSWRLGDAAEQAAMKGPLSLSTDGRCLLVGSPGRSLVVWPKGYSVVLRDGQVAVLDEAGAEVARVGDVIEAGGGNGDAPANSCGFGSAFHIQSKVSSRHP